MFNLQRLGSWTKEGILQRYFKFSRYLCISGFKTIQHFQPVSRDIKLKLFPHTGSIFTFSSLLWTENQSRYCYANSNRDTDRARILKSGKVALTTCKDSVKRRQNFYKPYHYLLLIEKTISGLFIWAFF